MVHSQDGYKTFKANQLLAVLSAMNSEQISFRSFRVYLACNELLAIREASERTKGKRAQQSPRKFRKEELERLVNCEEGKGLSGALNSLRRAGLLSFSESAIVLGDGESGEESNRDLVGRRGEKRIVPIPRKVLRFLACCTKPALAKTIVAYLLRGLSLGRSGELRGAGTVKISWICALCKISERAARSARAELIRIGWISKDTGSFQRKLNRDGAYFRINTSWGRIAHESAPHELTNSRESAPPLERTETPSDFKNQKLAKSERSGSWKEGRGEKPSLRKILPEDIRKPGRLLELFDQATRAGWIEFSEASRLNFAAAAVRANRAAGDSVRIFIGIVRKKLWHHITHQDEERGRAVLQRWIANRTSDSSGMAAKCHKFESWTFVREKTEIATTHEQTAPSRINESLEAMISRLARAAHSDESSLVPEKACASVSVAAGMP